MSDLGRITKQNQARHFSNQDAANKNSDRGNLVPSQPSTFVFDTAQELAALDEDIQFVGQGSVPQSTFRGRVPKDGDLAKTTKESINLDNEKRYFIRIDGEWVNILGLCNDLEAKVQPIHGIRSSPGTSLCLAAADHRHGVPDSKGYYDTTVVQNENGEFVERDEYIEYGEGSFFYDTEKKRQYVKCNEKWICISNVE